MRMKTIEEIIQYIEEQKEEVYQESTTTDKFIRY